LRQNKVANATIASKNKLS